MTAPAVTRFDNVSKSFALVLVSNNFWRTRLGTSAVSTDGESLELLEGEVRGSVHALIVGLKLHSVVRLHFSNGNVGWQPHCRCLDFLSPIETQRIEDFGAHGHH